MGSMTQVKEEEEKRKHKRKQSLETTRNTHRHCAGS